MGYYDPNLLNPALAGNNTPGGVAGLFQDRNFLQLLAGIGTGLDPKGVGGTLGIPTSNAISSQAAQERADKQAAAQNAQTRLVIEALNRHGGLTPKGVGGVRDISADNDGGVNMTIDPSPGNYSGSGLAEPIKPAPVPRTTRSAVESLLPFYSALLDPYKVDLSQGLTPRK